MTLNRNKLYLILFIACLFGYLWLYFNINKNILETQSIGACIIKSSTGFPCPSCGSTRSIIAILNGNFYNALYLNPLGYLVGLIMILLPFWILVDLINKKSSLFYFYRKIEIILGKKKYAAFAVLIILCNWIWNIIKD